MSLSLPGAILALAILHQGSCRRSLSTQGLPRGVIHVIGLQGQSKLSVLDLYPSAAAPPARSVDLQRAGISGYQRQPVAVPELPEPTHGHAPANRISAWLSPRPEGAPL